MISYLETIYFSNEILKLIEYIQIRLFFIVSDHSFFLFQ